MPTAHLLFAACQSMKGNWKGKLCSILSFVMQVFFFLFFSEKAAMLTSVPRCLTCT